MKTENRFLKRMVFAGLFAVFAVNSVQAEESTVSSASIHTGPARKKYDEFNRRWGKYDEYACKAFKYSCACAMAATALGKMGGLAGISGAAVAGYLVAGTGLLVAAISFPALVCLDGYEDVLMDKVIAEERACQAQAAA